jgi:high-affinity Fe2+/Pb2+ permease
MLSKCYKSIPFLLMTLVIGAISAYDNTLNFTDEQNPFALWIIKNHGVGGLIHLKAITTMIAVLIMCCLSFIRQYRLALIPVLVIQLALFYYLTFHTLLGAGIFGNGDGEVITPFAYYWDFIATGKIPDIYNVFDTDNLIAH